MKNNIRPNGLKGNEAISRMKDLMGIKPMTESTVDRAVVEITKMGPDGKIYGIVRENHKYHIKIASKNENIVTEDFQYIGGLVNKHKSGYPSYAEAIKQLNLSFISISEALGKSNTINAFRNDNIIKENDGETAYDRMYNSDAWVDAQRDAEGGKSTEYDEDGNEIKESEGTSGIVRGAGHDTHIMEMSDNELAIDEMLAGDSEPIEENFLQNNRLKIGKAISNISENEAKNAQFKVLIESLSEKDRLALIETLKKKA